MVEYELSTLVTMVSQIATALGVCIAATYYIINLRNTQKNMQTTLETRQTQLFMQLFSQYNDKDFMSDFGKIAYTMEYENLADWEKKYGPTTNIDYWASWTRVGRFFDGVGILVKRRLIDVDLVVEELRELILYSWDMMKPWVYEIRIVMKSEHTWENFEYLAGEARSRHSDVKPLDDFHKYVKEVTKGV